MESNKVVAAINDIADAMLKLDTVLESDWQDVSDGYPFGKDLMEVWHEVIEWRDRMAGVVSA